MITRHARSGPTFARGGSERAGATCQDIVYGRMDGVVLEEDGKDAAHSALCTRDLNPEFKTGPRYNTGNHTPRYIKRPVLGRKRMMACLTQHRPTTRNLGNHDAVATNSVTAHRRQKPW